MSKNKIKIKSDFFNDVSCLVNSPWEIEGVDGIKGTWCEDESSYYITAPTQLRESIIRMQHLIFKMSFERREMKEKIAELACQLADIDNLGV